MRNPIASALAACLLAAAASPAAADYVDFRYRASDLSTESGVQSLYQRLSARADRLCSLPQGTTRIVVESCATRLKDDWVAAIQDARLSELHRRASQG